MYLLLPSFSVSQGLELDFQESTTSPPFSYPSDFELPIWQYVIIAVSVGIAILAYPLLCCAVSH